MQPFALQHGVDAMMVPFEPGIISAAKKIAGEKPSKYAESTRAEARLSFADVTSIQSGGVGERVCVDRRKGSIQGKACWLDHRQMQWP